MKLQDLQSVSETVKALDDLATSSCSLVCAVELEVQQQGDDDDQTTGDETGVDTRAVARLILFAEHG